MNVNDPDYGFSESQKPDFQNQNFGGSPMKQESWIKRNGLWFFPLILVMLGIPVLCCGSAILGIGKLASAVTKPRDAAIEHMQRDQRVTDVLGSPLAAGSTYQMNNMSIHDDSGEMELSFAVKGPKGSANVAGKMTMTAGDWGPEKLTITCSDGTEIIIPQQEIKGELDE